MTSDNYRRIMEYVKENASLDTEHTMLMVEFEEAMRNRMYFSAGSILSIIIEKYVRMMVIVEELKQSKPSVIEFRERLAEIENYIEDKTNGHGYSFKELCGKLKGSYKLDDNLELKLIEIYNRLRNPIQHGIYQRLVRMYVWDQKIWVLAVDDGESTSVEKMMQHLDDFNSWKTNAVASSINPEFRAKYLPGIFEKVVLELLEVFEELVKSIKANP